MKAVVETTHEAEQEPEPRTIEVQLWPDDAELLDELTERTGRTASELLPHALGALWRELEGIVLPPPGPPVDMEKVLAESEEDIRAGRTYSNEEVFGRLKAKHGW